MKKLIFLSALCFGSWVFSQSVTEQYNSLYKRYEYFDSNGNMIGYKTYNNLTKNWEYYEKSTPSPYSGRTKNYLDYVNPYDTGGIIGMMGQKQKTYDNNVEKIRNIITNIKGAILRLNISESIKNTIIDTFSNEINNNLNNQRIDFSSNANTESVINWLYTTAESIIKNETSK